jgi:hypothetical protein
MHVVFAAAVVKASCLFWEAGWRILQLAVLRKQCHRPALCAQEWLCSLGTDPVLFGAVCLCLQHNGGYISDNRMNFLFGNSERGGLERAFDALQAELDALGVTDGLTRQQVRQPGEGGRLAVITGW